MSESFFSNIQIKVIENKKGENYKSHEERERGNNRENSDAEDKETNRNEPPKKWNRIERNSIFCSVKWFTVEPTNLLLNRFEQ